MKVQCDSATLTNQYCDLLTADDQLEDGTKESLEDSKGEADPTSSLEGGNDSIAESTEEGGVEKETASEVDGVKPTENSSPNGTDVKDDVSEVLAENTPVVGDEVKESENPSGITDDMKYLLSNPFNSKSAKGHHSGF